MTISITPDKNIRSYVGQNGDKENFPLLTLGNESYINGLELDMNLGNEVTNIQIGNFCSIAHNVFFLVNRNHDYKSITTAATNLFGERKRQTKQKGQIIIGHDAWIGNNTIIMSGVRIGNGAVIGAGAVVAKEIPAYAIAVGNPVRVIKYRFDEEQRKKLLTIKWWNWDYCKLENNKHYFSCDIDSFINTFYEVEAQSREINFEKNTKSILFMPDFYDPYPLWEKIIKEYINTFSNQDDISLILWVPKDDNYQDNLQKISKLVDFAEEIPHILIVNDYPVDERRLFKGIDYFITSRSMHTMRYIDYADEFGVEIKSGVDIPVFDCDFVKICNVVTDAV